MVRARILSSDHETWLDKKDREAMKSFKDMLSFYGVQLQSHAALVLGLALLVFAIVQAWGQLVAASGLAPLTTYQRVFFSVIVGIVGAGILFELLRLYTYGKLASSLQWASERAFRDARDFIEARHRQGDAQWREFHEFRKITSYASWMFSRSAKLRRAFDPNLRPRIAVIVAGGVLSGYLSWGLIFGSFGDLEALFLIPITAVLLPLFLGESSPQKVVEVERAL